MRPSACPDHPLSKILRYWRTTAVLSSLYSPGSSIILGGGLKSLIAFILPIFNVYTPGLAQNEIFVTPLYNFDRF